MLWATAPSVASKSQSHPPPDNDFLQGRAWQSVSKACSASLRLLRQAGCFPAALRPARPEAVLRPMEVGTPFWVFLVSGLARSAGVVMSANLFAAARYVLCVPAGQLGTFQISWEHGDFHWYQAPADGRIQAGLKQRFCAWGRRGVACQICTAEAQAAHPHTKDLVRPRS